MDYDPSEIKPRASCVKGKHCMLNSASSLSHCKSGHVFLHLAKGFYLLDASAFKT